MKGRAIMSRYVNQLQLPRQSEQLTNQINEFMTREGFKIIQYKGQQVWKKGMGIITAPQYLAISYGPGFVQIEAFIRYAILPGVYIGEMGIGGVFGSIPKSNLKNRVQRIEQFIIGLL
jgi:hypothetical protein